MAGQFLDALSLHPEEPDSEIVVLDAPLRYRSDNGLLFTIPNGFRSDLASVPGALRSIAPPWQQSARSGVLHDCGYRWFEVWELPRDEIDRLFYEGLRADGTGRFRARMMRWAVEWFGGPTWKRWRNTCEGDKGVKPPPVQS